MKALIVGKSGQVAWELMQTCPDDITASCYGRDDLNILDLHAIEALVAEQKPQVIINASAYTAVDKAETEQAQAFAINGTAVENLAIVAKQHGARLIHISTDFVFDGQSASPYKVDDVPNPINVYGASKLAGENAVKKHYPENAAIVRTSWVYSTHGNNFVKTMLRLMAEKESLNVVSDQIGSPTYAKGLAAYLWYLAKSEQVDLMNHYSDLGVASWYDFAVAIQDIAFQKGVLSKKIPISPISASQYPTPAKRPKFSLLEKQEGIGEMLYWKAALKEMLEDLCKR